MKSLIAIAALLSAVLAHNKNEWKTRTVYQILTDRFGRSDGSTSKCNNLGNYCGGTFKGIQKNLDYIKGMGFDAIWISPVVDNSPGGYHGYWAANWEKINSHFGTE
jgi:alpha-amylase